MLRMNSSGFLYFYLNKFEFQNSCKYFKYYPTMWELNMELNFSVHHVMWFVVICHNNNTIDSICFSSHSKH